MLRRFLIVALFLCPHAYGLDSTILLEADQAWHKDQRQKTELEFLWEMDHALSQTVSLTSIVRSRIHGPDRFDPGQPDQPAVAPASRRHHIGDNVEIELRELYADIRLPAGNLRLGKQQIVWGQADGLKLLDVINPQDFREFILDDFEDSRIPVWTLNLELFLDEGDLQLVWIPDTSRHNLPPAGATYGLTAPFASIPADQPFRIEAIDRPNNAIEDGTWATRFSTFRAGWDITLNYLYRYNDLPVIRKNKNVDGSLLLSPGYERTHTLGGSLSKAFGDFIFRSEVAVNGSVYFDTKNVLPGEGVGRTKELGYVMGLDWSGLGSTLISAQIFQSILIDHDLGQNRFARDKVDTTLTLLVRRDFWNESLVADVLWIYHTNDNDQLVRLKVDYEWSSQLMVGLYADWFAGSADELFGQYDNRDQIGLRLQFGF